jgi:glycosyltransferase involved in cell wall biosynthesis
MSQMTTRTNGDSRAKPRLILSANGAPSVGGQGQNLQNMLEGLGDDFDLYVFARTGCGATPGEVVPNLNRYARLYSRVPFIRHRRDWWAHWCEAYFDRYVSSRIPAAPVFQGVVGQSARSFAAARRLGCRTVLDCVTYHVDDFAEAIDRECSRFGVRGIVSGAQRARIRSEYERADLIRVMSARAGQSFLDRGFPPEKLVTVPPILNNEEFPQADFAGEKFRISFVGLIEPWKGFHYLIEAFNALGRSDCELILWGGPSPRPIRNYLLQQMAANPAIHQRPVEVRRVGYGEVYAKSHVLVHPSLTDGFGLVVAEAMASGIPVIVTSTSGAADWVTDGVNGYVVPPRDSAAIRERLRHLIDKPALVRQMGREARETARRLNVAAFRQCFVPRIRELLN